MNGGCFIVSPFSLKGEKHHFTNWQPHFFFFFFFLSMRKRETERRIGEYRKRLSDASESTEERLRRDFFALSIEERFILCLVIKPIFKKKMSQKNDFLQRF